MKRYFLTRPLFDRTEIERVAACLDSRWVTQGPMVEEFEKLFAIRHGLPHALATTSCTAALHLATMALGLGQGDDVIVPAFTWVTSANCAEYVRARAVFVDIELETFNIDPKALEAAITPKTRAVVAVHLFGLAARMNEIMAIAERHKLVVIEDAACAVGAIYDSKPVGGIGNVGCFSFHPRKVITTGEGGMITTRDAVMKSRIDSLRNHGITGLKPEEVNKPYAIGEYDLLGYNMRMSDIQAAVGVAQMAKLDGLLAERKRLAESYSQSLQDVEGIALPGVPEKCGHTYQSYVIRLRNGSRNRRNLIMERLESKGIQSRPGTQAVHRLGYYRDKYHLHPEMFPNACLGEDMTITLPIFPGMTDQDQEFVMQALREALTAIK